MNDRAVYFEHRVWGDSLRVAAIDSVSGHEVVVFGPANAPPMDLERLALRKLQRTQSGIAEDAVEGAPAAPRRGLIA